MSLITTIENASKDALRAGDRMKRSALNDLLDRANKIGKNETPPRECTDADVVKATQKMLSGLEETRSFLAKGNIPQDDERYATLDAEKAVLEVYLPKQMTEEEILAAIKDQPKSIGPIMGYLKKNHAGNYDGTLAAAVASKYIAS